MHGDSKEKGIIQMAIYQVFEEISKVKAISHLGMSLSRYLDDNCVWNQDHMMNDSMKSRNIDRGSDTSTIGTGTRVPCAH